MPPLKCRFYDRGFVIDNIIKKLLKNFDIAIGNTLLEGEVVLKKYCDLDFYLKEIAFGKKNTYKARQVKKEKGRKKLKSNQK